MSGAAECRTSLSRRASRSSASRRCERIAHDAARGFRSGRRVDAVYFWCHGSRVRFRTRSRPGVRDDADLRISRWPRDCGTGTRQPLILEKAIHRKGRQGREGKQRTTLVIKITNLVITSIFDLMLISLASIPHPRPSPERRGEARDSLPSLVGEGHGMGDGVLRGSIAGFRVVSPTRATCAREGVNVGWR